MPGIDGDIVADVQQAVIDAGVDLDGGADGVYGNDTMAAVAEFQRQAGDLQVTGAVDLATARALGLVENTDANGPAAVEATTDESTPASQPTPQPAAADPIDGDITGQGLDVSSAPSLDQVHRRGGWGHVDHQCRSSASLRCLSTQSASVGPTRNSVGEIDALTGLKRRAESPPAFTQWPDFHDV